MSVFSWVVGWAVYTCSHCYLCQYLSCVFSSSLPGWIYPELCLYCAPIERELRCQCSSQAWVNKELPHSFVPTHLACKVPKISSGENLCEVFHAGRCGSDSHPAYIAFEVSKQKTGGSIHGAGFKKLRPVREARRLQQATG